ncbi:hypothetical protein EJB05_22485, partial [Eragrostis curvula]
MPFEIHLPVIPIGDGCGCAGWTKKIPFSPSAVSSVIDIDSRLDQPGRLIERMGEEQEDKAGELSYCGAGRSRRVELRPEAGEGGRSAWCAAAACGKGVEGEAGVRRSTEEGACRAARRAAREGGSAAVKRGREWARSAAEARCKGEEGDGHGARTPRRSGGGGGRSVRGESGRKIHPCCGGVAAVASDVPSGTSRRLGAGHFQLAVLPRHQPSVRLPPACGVADLIPRFDSFPSHDSAPCSCVEIRWPKYTRCPARRMISYPWPASNPSSSPEDQHFSVSAAISLNFAWLVTSSVQPR